MILTCSACSTRYLVGDAAIGVEGRTVRCAKCGHTWHVEGVARIQAAAVDEDGEEAGAPPAMAGDPAAEETSRDAALAQRLRPIPQGSGLPALPGDIRRPFPVGWIVLLLVVIAVIAGLIFGREALVAAWPPANRIYASFGFPVDLPGMGLAFRDVTSSRTEENGRSFLLVRGRVANITNAERAVPGVRILLKDEQDQVVQDWSFKTDRASIGPGEAVPFETRVAEPSAQARGLTIEFVAGP